jgi:WD40 repeat protein
MLALSTDDDVIHLRSTRSDKDLHQFQESRLRDLAWAGDGQTLAVSNYFDGTVTLWDPNGGAAAPFAAGYPRQLHRWDGVLRRWPAAGDSPEKG